MVGKWFVNSPCHGPVNFQPCVLTAVIGSSAILHQLNNDHIGVFLGRGSCCFALVMITWVHMKSKKALVNLIFKLLGCFHNHVCSYLFIMTILTGCKS